MVVHFDPGGVKVCEVLELRRCEAGGSIGRVRGAEEGRWIEMAGQRIHKYSIGKAIEVVALR